MAVAKLAASVALEALVLKHEEARPALGACELIDALVSMRGAPFADPISEELPGRALATKLLVLRFPRPPPQTRRTGQTGVP